MREGQRINFKLLGQWALADKVIKGLPSSLKEAYREAQRNMGKKLERTVKTHIRNQDLPWKPLAESTVQRKGDSTIYIQDEDYYQAIRTYASGPYQISVGVKEGSVNSKGKDIAMYAAVNEYGHTFESNRKIPKRPLWIPSWNGLGGKEGMANEVANSFQRIANRKGFGAYIENKQKNF